MSETSFPYAFVAGRARVKSEYVALVCTGMHVDAMERRRAVLFPADKSIRVKRVSCGSSAECTVEIKGAGTKEAKTGSFLCPEELLPEWGAEGYGLPIGGSTVPAGRYGLGIRDIRSAGGTDRGDTIAEIVRRGTLIRFRARKPLPLLPGRTYRLREVHGSGSERRPENRMFRLLVPGPLDEAGEGKLRAWIREHGMPKPQDFPQLFLHVRGWSFLPAEPQNRRRGGAEQDYPGAAVIHGEGLLLQDSLLRDCRDRLSQAAGKMGGISRAEALRALTLSGRAARGILSGLKREGAVAERDGRIVSANGDAAGRLSPAARRLFEDAKSAGTEGLELSAEQYRGLGREAKHLEVMGLTVPLEGGRIVARDAYLRLVAEALEGLKPGDRISAGVLRKEKGYSRARIGALLDRMESDGYLERGDRRVVDLPEREELP